MKYLLKRTLCLLLVLVMCFGMIPTVGAADQTAEISFASTAQRTSYSASAQVWENGGVTMTNNKAASTTDVGNYSNPARFYASSNLVIEAPGNITKIVFTASGSSYATALKNSAGSEATVSGSTVTIIPTASATTYTIAKLTAQVRATKLVVTYEEADGCQHSYTSVVTPPTATEQGYTTYTCSVCGDSYKDNFVPALGQTYTVSFSVPAGVTAPAAMECNSSGITLPTVAAPEGYTFAGWTNSAVEDTDTAPTIYTGSYVAAADTTLYALYTYTVADGGSVEYVLTDITAISATDEVVVTMTYGSTVYALTNGNGTSKAPAATIVSVADGKLSNTPAEALIWNVGGDSNGYTFYPNGSTSTWLYCTGSNNGVRVGTNAAKTFIIDTDSGYLKHTGTSRYLGVYRTNPDWRCYTGTGTNINDQTLGFYVKSAGGTTYYTTLSTAACTHENTTDTTVDATCTAAGSVTTVCDDCGMTVDIVTIPATGHQNTTTTTVAATCTEAGSTTETCDDCDAIVSVTAIPALGHALENGVCGNCGKEIPDYSGDYYIATKRTEGNYFYMTNDLGTASTKRYLAEEQSATLPESIVNGEADKTFTLILQDDGTYIIKTGDLYLGWGSGNSGTLVEEDDALRLTVEVNDEGLFNIHFTGDEERYLSLNGATGNDYFAFYKGTQKQDLSLIPVTECAHENTTTTTVDATCTENGSVTVTCDDCGETVSTEVIPATGHVDTTTTTVAATCTEDGSVTVTCACGVTVSTEVIPATGHVNTTTTTVDATCTETGSVTVTCACGVTVSTEVIPATGHAYTDGVCGCGEKANVQVGTNWYTTVQEAVNAASAGGYVKLLDNSAEVITVEKDLYLDLNGFKLNEVVVAEGATLYGVDTTTDDYDCANGYGTIASVTGTVATQYRATVNGKIRRYVTCNEDGALSFHRLYVGVTNVSLRPGASGMGYKATIAGDQKVLEMIDGQVSMTMWVEGYEDQAITKSTTMSANRVTLSALVKGMDVAEHYDMVVCANVSVVINNEQITSSTTEYTLKRAIEAVADAVAGGTTYSDSQMSAIQKLCSPYGELMATWSNIGSILNWTANA